MIDLLDYMCPRLEPEEVAERLTVLPPVPDVEGKAKSQRLACLQTIYKVFVPMPMAVETYYKLYEALSRALQKKATAMAARQQVENYKGLRGQEFSGIVGGADSISIVGESGTGKTAKIMSTSKYVETTRTVINEQKVTVKNIGAYEVKKWHIKARPVTVNKETGDIEFGNLVTLHTAEHIAACQDRTYLIPGNYGQIEFHYDITWGSLWPYAGRIDTNDFIGEAKIETGGTTFHNWVRFSIDGRTREV